MRLSWTCAFGVLFVACSSNPPPAPPAPATTSNTSSSPPPASEPTREEFASALAKTVCEASRACCIGGTSYDDASCQKQFLEKLEWKERVAKTKTYAAAHATKCLEEARGQGAKCTASRDDILRLPSCAALLTGPKKTGEPCEENTDCAPPAKGEAFCWTGAMADEPGRCAVTLPPERGAACFTPLSAHADKNQLTFSDCNRDPGLLCDKATNKCGPRVKTGGACEQPYECDDSSACVAGKCKMLLGAACKSPRECAVNQACTNGTCGPGKKLGEPCRDLGECADGGLCSNGVCLPWAGAFLCNAPKK